MVNNVNNVATIVAVSVVVYYKGSRTILSADTLKNKFKLNMADLVLIPGIFNSTFGW